MTQNSSNDKPVIIYTDEACMRLALSQANLAAEEGEVPVGAVVLWQGRIIARAHNQVELLKDATAHAEILALTQASAAKGDWRLDDCTLFVTKEPCAMCAGAIANARISAVYFGAYEKKGGACGSIHNVLENNGLNAVVACRGGVLGEECSDLIKEFFENKRNKMPEQG